MIRWWGVPSSAVKTVRKTSWRPTTSANAERNASTSSTPVNRTATGML
nr:hypothetical protein [Streptomyces sp. MH191]